MTSPEFGIQGLSAAAGGHSQRRTPSERRTPGCCAHSACHPPSLPLHLPNPCLVLGIRPKATPLRRRICPRAPGAPSTPAALSQCIAMPADVRPPLLGPGLREQRPLWVGGAGEWRLQQGAGVTAPFPSLNYFAPSLTGCSRARLAHLCTFPPAAATRQRLRPCCSARAPEDAE